MRVVVVGAGGREHALAWALERSAEVVVTPGNAGMAAAGIACTATPPEELEADLVVVGPEAPLVAGLADALRAKGRAVVGPGAEGARLEGSKAFAKRLAAEAGVRTAPFAVFDDLEAARAHLRATPGPWVVKADGLAAGKGVLVTDSLAEAEADVEAKLSGRAFGDAGRRVVLEAALDGPELSLLVVTDGRRVVALPPAQDAKRLLDGDRGPNTGGMGAYSPVPGAGDKLVDEAVATVIEPVLDALRRRGVEYRGVLYAGLMLTTEGPALIEFNVRFGDPEAQAILPRLDRDFDLAAFLLGAAEGRLRGEPRVAEPACVTVVLAAAGYPGAPVTGAPIEGLDAAVSVPGVTVFHAATAADAEGRLVVGGGRVLDVTAVGPTLAKARARAYEAAAAIAWPGLQYRRDLARQAAGIPASGAEDPSPAAQPPPAHHPSPAHPFPAHPFPTHEEVPS
jgi:phosphoribosylamine--glycine ligase